MILVVGATGRLGQVVTRELLRRNHRVRAGCRQPDRAGSLSALGAEVSCIDLRDPSSFPAALAGVNQVVAAVQGLTGRRADTIAKVDLEGHRRLIDAAEAAGVQRFIYVSAQGASPAHPSAFLRAKAEVEDHLGRSTLPHNILRPTAFLELYAHELIGAAILAGKRVVLLGDGASNRNLVSIDDVAAAIVAAAEGQLSAQMVPITGPTNATDREVAATYARLSGLRAKITSLPPTLIRAIATAIGPFHAGVRNLLLFAEQNHQHGSLVADATHMKAILGREPIALDSFAKAQIAKLR